MNGDFKTYRGRYISAVGIPTVIAAVYSSSQGRRWHGEIYIFLSGAAPAFHMQRCSIDGTQVPEELVVLDSQYMHAELLQQAQGVLSQCLYDKYVKAGGDVLLGGQIELQESEAVDIVRLWMRREFSSDLKKIKEITKCTALNDFLFDVVNLPHISGPET